MEHALFEEKIWPVLAERVRAFEALKVFCRTFCVRAVITCNLICLFQVQSAWAGHYDFNTLDQNGIIGPHPHVKNFIFANGFSGHGIQQAPAVGRAVSEIIVDGHTHSIDLSIFAFERIVSNRPLMEKNVV